MRILSSSVILASIVCLPFGVLAQTKTPNAGAPTILRTWPSNGNWSTALARRPDKTLSCIMLSGHVEGGQARYLVGLRQLPAELALIISDIEHADVSGKSIRLIIDEVEIGNFDITRRLDDEGTMHSIAAAVPTSDTQRIINLFRTGATVKFVTERATFTVPLTGAAQSIQNMRDCIVEAANLAPSGTVN